MSSVVANFLFLYSLCLQEPASASFRFAWPHAFHIPEATLIQPFGQQQQAQAAQAASNQIEGYQHVGLAQLDSRDPEGGAAAHQQQHEERAAAAAAGRQLQAELASHSQSHVCVPTSHETCHSCLPRVCPVLQRVEFKLQACPPGANKNVADTSEDSCLA